MISLRTFQKGSSTSLISLINRADSLLIIGSADSDCLLNEFVSPSSLSEVQDVFGSESELTNAYTDAVNNGATNVFLMNCYKTTDYIDCIKYVSKYNFAFIVPVGINLSDKFNSEEEKRELYIAEYYLSEFSKYTNSVLIFTDKHISLYEDLDSYLSDMKNKVMVFKDSINYLANTCGRNLMLCMNMLDQCKSANVVLAAQLSKSKIGHYPSNIDLKALYDIDSSDIDLAEIVYFKNNYLTNTSIENLNNFRTICDANKVAVIDRVIKYIERSLDTTFIIGKSYNQYTVMLLQDYLDSYFMKLMESSIKNYSIKDIRFIKNIARSGYFIVDIDILPINSLEIIQSSLEVN